ncbi:uncharacterized protein LOC132637522 [Lycium barbarum]|uniref:uncharacterized protein LOC132637522 n=1 Tax=Lycium barbarum TaxID=112863 RepID=UPI00293EC3A1|nr:uncharacterized protein LOC132637522 [Lycium barbarum]
MEATVGGPSRTSQHYSSQPGGSYTRAPDYDGYSASSVSVRHPTLDRGCLHCDNTGHFKRNYPRLSQGVQGTQFQAPRAPVSSRRGGSCGGNRVQSGRGSHTASRVGNHPNRGGFQSGRGGNMPGRGGAQTGQVDRNGSQATGRRVHCYAFPAGHRLRAQM